MTQPAEVDRTDDLVRVLDNAIDEAAPQGNAVMVARAEVDSAIVTARRYPRSIAQVMTTARTLATFNEDVADSMYYSLKRHGKDGEKFIIGPSIRMAEVMQSAWGNLHVDAMFTHSDDKHVYAMASCWDLERNVKVRQQSARRITNSAGRRYNDDMVMTTINAAIAIAKRNAITSVVPRALVETILREAIKVSVGEATTLVARRQAMFEYFTGKLGVPAAQLFATLEVKGIEDVTLEHLGHLKGIASALRDGQTTLAEAFPPTEAKPDGKDATGAVEGMIDAIRHAGPDGPKQAETIAMAFDSLGFANGQRLSLLVQFKGKPLDLIAHLRDVAVNRGKDKTEPVKTEPKPEPAKTPEPPKAEKKPARARKPKPSKGETPVEEKAAEPKPEPPKRSF